LNWTESQENPIDPPIEGGVVFVDLDRCLLIGDSISSLFSLLWKKRKIGKFSLSFGILAKTFYQFGVGDPKKLVRSGVKGLKGMKKEELYSIGMEVYEKSVKGRYHSKLLREMEKHRKAGRKIVLLTGGLPPIPQEVGKEVGMDEVCSTLPVVDEKGVLTGEIIEPPCVGEGKIVYAHKTLRKWGENFSRTWFYTDSFTDLPLLRLVQFGVVVNPDPLLRRYAQKEGLPFLPEEKS
jgi:HAD superfamily hydrolase (TIGR01490 family)